jgi:hypothetical protein
VAHLAGKVGKAKPLFAEILQGESLREVRRTIDLAHTRFVYQIALAVIL